MKNKQGFTLIELLAVIVILAVIALIVTPVITGIIKKVRDSADLRSAEAYVKAGENYFSKSTLTSSTLDSNVIDDLELSATPAKEGSSVIVHSNGSVEMTIVINDKCYIKSSNSNEIEVQTEYVNCTTAQVPPDRCFTYKDVDGGISITNYLCGNSVSYKASLFTFANDGEYTNIIIPNYIDGKLVVGISYGAFSPKPNSNKGIRHLIIPDNIISLDEFAFSDNQLIDVEIGNGLNKINRYDFSNNQLTSITIPNNIATIDDSAFEHNKLTSINIGTGVTNFGLGAFNDNLLPDDQAYIYFKNADGSDDKSIVVSYGGANKAITIPNNITTIAEEAFYNCKLTNLNLSSSVQSIGDAAFNGNLLKTVTIPDGITKIQYGSFANNQLESLSLPNSVTTIENYAFYNNQLKTITIPENVTSIGVYSLMFNTGLTNIYNKSSISNTSSIWNSAIAGNTTGDISNVSITTP